MKRRSVSTILVVILFLTAVAAPTRAGMNTVFVVNSTGGQIDGDTSDGICDTGNKTVGFMGVCTLRAATGPNNLQNYPVLTSARFIGGSIMVQGTLNCTPGIPFTLDFFYSAACDRSGFGEGQTFLGSSDVTTDGSGNATISVTLST